MKSGVMASGKRWIKEGLVTSGVLRLTAWCRPVTGIVLMYHSILDDPRECADTIGVENIHSTETFRKQMEYVARNYELSSIEDLLHFLDGQKTMPRNPVVVTFDDGYADNFEVAAQVLNRLGIPGAFYVTVESANAESLPWFCHLRHAFASTRKKSWQDPTGRHWDLGDRSQRDLAFSAACEAITQLAGTPQHEALQGVEQDLDTEPLVTKKNLMMTWEQAKKLCRGGHIVGSHSLTHPNMAHIADDDLQRELVESRLMLERELEIPVVHFSYPAAALSVSWTQHTLRATDEAGYKTAVTTTPGLVKKTNNPLSLRRIAAPDDFDQFQWTLQYVSSFWPRS